MNYCTTCKNGVMEKGTTTVTFDKDNMVIVFRHVPAQVCNVCGDYTIEGDVAKALLQAAKEERAKGHELTVVNYQKAA
ncbi:MAG: type II toxin-antitoxin system MqsA family antitoxin [Chitinophagales bacterium]|nr:type II toxin-antitoxin system MqsA family antitoxin [Chitinophagales bacterium]